MKRPIPLPMTSDEVDARLNGAIDSPERFEIIASELIDELDANARDLEIREPSSWRKPALDTPKRGSWEHQFRADVERIETMDRESEARLARRIELARMRLERACASNDGCSDDCLDAVGRKAAAYTGDTVITASVPAVVLRRAAELHALRTEMVERNLYLALINVERYAQTGASRTDLIQEGSAALYRAVDGFDWRRGLLFRTYAVHWLNQAFRNYLYNHGHTVRVPVYLQKALKHINQAQIRLGDPKASAEEIAKAAEMNENLVTSALAAARSSYSIDSGPSDNDEGNRLRDVLATDEPEGGYYSTRLEDVSLEQGLRRAMERLSDRERFVVTRRFGLAGEREHTLSEVAAELGVSVERVRQIQVRAISKLDTPGLRRELDPFLN